MSVDENLDEVPPALYQRHLWSKESLRLARPAHGLLHPSGGPCFRVTVLVESQLSSWTGDASSFPIRQLEQARDPEPNVRALRDSQSAQNTIRCSK